MEGTCHLDEAVNHNGEIPITFQSNQGGRTMYFSGMLNGRHSNIVGKWGSTSDCSEGLFAMARSNHVQLQLKVTDRITGKSEQIKVELTPGRIHSHEGTPSTFILEASEHINNAELKYFVLQEDV